MAPATFDTLLSFEGDLGAESDDDNEEEQSQPLEAHEDSESEQEFVREESLTIGNIGGWRRGSAAPNLDSDGLRK